MPYREELEALSARADALERELAVTRGAIAELRRRGSLARLRIASPCSADWNEMKGDDRVRFCGRCGKHVYNLLAMTQAEAENLLVEKEGRACLKLYRRWDGTVLTRDCPVGLRWRRFRWVSIGALVAAIAGIYGCVRRGGCMGLPADLPGLDDDAGSFRREPADAPLPPPAAAPARRPQK